MDTWQALRRWRDFLDVTGVAESTRDQYLYWVLKVASRVLTDPRSLSEDDVVAYLASRPPKGGERASTLRALKSLYRFLEDREMAVDPTRRLKIPRTKLGRAPSLTEEELLRLALAAAWHRPEDPRRPWGILFCYGIGARLESVCAVRPEDIRGGVVWLRLAKGDRPYEVPMGPTAQAAAGELIRLLDWRPRAVPDRHPTLVGVGPGQFYSWVAQAGRDAGVHSWPHLLRHTFATRVAEKAESPQDVVILAELLNHADLSQIKRYVATFDQRRRRMVEPV